MFVDWRGIVNSGADAHFLQMISELVSLQGIIVLYSDHVLVEDMSRGFLYIRRGQTVETLYSLIQRRCVLYSFLVEFVELRKLDQSNCRG